MGLLNNYFIRFGGIPENEQSTEYIGSGDGQHPNKTLNGVSVYECVKDDNNIPRLVLPKLTHSTLDTLYGLFNYSNRSIYLVTGDIVGTGTDGEPLIRNINIVRELSLNDFLYKQ